MIASETQCVLPRTICEKTWLYIQSYTGEKDNEQRKNGQGDIHWSGAKSLESYSGDIVCDTIHGEGNYRWRYYGPQGSFATYEGYFFNNQLHGYGTMSYDDGRVFEGIFHGNVRWGPGVESHATVNEDVGLWNGTRLIRICWRPDGPCVTPDLMSSIVGREFVKPHRRILSSSVKTLGEVNSALELLKHYGANPLTAVEKSRKLYPRHCTDIASALCHTEMFENKYFKGKIYSLEDVNEEIDTNCNKEISVEEQESGFFYVWNNNDEIKHMMKHCYKHESQRKILGLDLASILSGPRKTFKPAGQHEIDCRTLLMASYLGHISTVAQLINKNKIHPDVCDVQGNTALMYATCGNKTDVIRFLMDAGANVNSYNDSCCTPLGVALINLTCAHHDIPQNGTLQAILPTNSAAIPPFTEQQIREWFIMREQLSPNVVGPLTKSPSKLNKNLSSKRIKSLLSLKDQSGAKKKSEVVSVKVDRISEESCIEEKSLYNDVSREYTIKVDDVYQTTDQHPVLYLFEINDMIKEVDANENEPKKLPDKNPKKVISKVLREATKPSKEAMWLNEKDENKSIDSAEKQKRDMLERIMVTIFQLLCYRADPKLVTCPHPALFIAITSGSSEAVRHLICHGAEVNELYPEVLGYTALDIAVSRPFTYDNTEIIKTLLEHGAETQHRLVYDVTDGMSPKILGPTLLHAVLARRTESETEEEIRHQVLELLLDYNCSPIAQFKGRTAIDISMTKGMNIFDIFIRNSKTNLNSIINDLNQSILVKMFYLPYFKTITGTERLQKITDLLLFGANPLIECQNGEEKFENIFVFAKKTLSDLEGNQTKLTTPTGTSGKQDPKNKKVEKPKKDDKISTKSMGKMTDDLGEYKQAIELVTDCARLLHIRWIQAKLVKELIFIIVKYRHRHWSMILKEVKFKKNIDLWLLPQRCLEMWHILANAKQSKHNDYGDLHILKHLLNIVRFCTHRVTNRMSWKKRITAVENEVIETNNVRLLHDYNDSDSLNSEILLKRCYVKPELIKSDAKMFNVCFECGLPLFENKIKCVSCGLISFCTLDCIKFNINRINCHPCSQILKDIYFPNTSDTVLLDV